MNSSMALAAPPMSPPVDSSVRNLRVMHLMPSLAMGGMENGVVNLCNRLPERRFESSVSVIEGGGPLEARLDPDRTKVHVVPRGFGNDPRVVLKLARLIRRHRVDVLHTHSWGVLLEGLAAARLTGAALVHGEHGAIELRGRNVFVQRWAWRMVNRVLSVSSALADDLSRAIGFPRQRITVISNGVDTERFRPLTVSKASLRRELGLPESGLLLGMVARFVGFKDHAGVLSAVAALKARGHVVHLALAGDGPLRGELESQARTLQIADRIHFQGELPRVERFLNALDACVSNSSHQEGMSNAVLEAMACGLPVIATRVAASPELLGEGAAGILIPPREVPALAAACERLVREPELSQNLGALARERAETVFSIFAMVEAYSQLYSDVATRRYRRRLSKHSHAEVET